MTLPALQLPESPTTHDIVEFAREAALVIEARQASGQADWHIELNDMLAQLFRALPEKVEALFYVHRRLTNEADQLGEEIRRLSKRKRSLERQADQVRDLGYALVKEHAELTDLPVRTPRVTASIRQSLPKVVVEDLFVLREVCPDLVKTEYTPVRAAIRADLEKGREVPGAHLVHGDHLDWR